jgi:hypothetical protein
MYGRRERVVDVEKRIKTATTHAVRQRNYRRVRDRALRRLGNLYPDQYRELLEEERARDEAENKVWLDISGRTNASLGLSTDNSQPSEVANGLGNQGKAG